MRLLNTLQIYTFGGLTFAEDGAAVFLSDVHVLNLMDMEWSEVDCTGSPPSPRARCLSFRYDYSTQTLIGPVQLINL